MIEFIFIIFIFMYCKIKSLKKEKSQFEEKDYAFNKLLEFIKEDEYNDTATIDAVLYAYDETKNSNIDFTKDKKSSMIFKNIMNNIELILSKNSNSNSKSNKTDKNIDNIEIEGQISLFPQFEEQEQLQKQEQTQNQPIPQQNYQYKPPSLMNTSTATTNSSDNQPYNTESIQNPAKKYENYAYNDINAPYKLPEIKDTPVKKAIELDTSSIVLILGVVLVLTSAIIFSTTIWSSVDSIFKIGILLGLGLINFIISFAFYKRFEVKSPSIAFYTLGYSFISFSTITFGYFYVNSNINLIFDDVGWLFTLSLFCSLICSFSFWGYKIFRKNQFLWTSLLFTDATIFTLSKAIFDNANIVLFILSIYAVALVYLLNSSNIKNVRSTVLDFSKANLLIISAIVILTTQANIFTIAICGILAGGFLLSHNKQFNNNMSSIFFAILMMTGLFKAGFGNGLDLAFLLLSFFPFLVFIFKIMNILDNELQQKLNFITLISGFFIFISNSIYIFSVEPSMHSVITLIVLFISITLLNTSKVYNYIHPFLIITIVHELYRYISFNTYIDSMLVIFNISLLVFGIFLFYVQDKKYSLNTYVSQNIFPLYILFISYNVEFMRTLTTLDYSFLIFFTTIVIICYIINVVNEKNLIIQYVYALFSVMLSVMSIKCFAKIFYENNIHYNHIIAIYVFAFAVLIYYLKDLPVITKFILPFNLIYTALAQKDFYIEPIKVTTLEFKIQLVLLFVAYLILYWSQTFINKNKNSSNSNIDTEKNNNINIINIIDIITLKYMFPFILIFDVFSLTSILCLCPDMLYYIGIICLITIASVIIKPNSYFQLPFNLMIFATNIYICCELSNNRYIIGDISNISSYLVIIATYLYYIYQLYIAYKNNEINNKKHLYIFVLTTLLAVFTGDAKISQTILIVLTAFAMNLYAKKPDITHIKICIAISNVLLNIMLFIQASSRIRIEDIIIVSILNCLSFAMVTIISNKNNIISVIGIFSLYWSLINNFYRLLSTVTNEEIAVVTPIIILNVALYFSKFITIDGFNRLTQKLLFDKSSTVFNLSIFKNNINIKIPINKVDYFSFVGIVGIFMLLDEGYPSHAFLMLALYFLNFTNRGFKNNNLINNWLVTGSITSLSLSALTQELIHVERLYRTEYNLLILISLIIILQKIWKEKFPVATYYYTMIFNIVVLFFDIILYKEVFDSILLGVILIITLLYGLHVKRLKIVVLSITSVLLLITFISFAFWNNSYWFAYLILTGIFLIGLSLNIENKKRKVNQIDNNNDNHTDTNNDSDIN